MPGQLFRLLLCLFVLSSVFSEVIRSQSSTMLLNENISDQLQNLAYGDVLLGDFDADGDADILLSGEDEHLQSSYIYRNDGNSVYAEIDPGFPSLSFLIFPKLE